MIPIEKVDLFLLCSLLDDAVIDWTQNGTDALYVTSLSVPLWVDYDAEQTRIVMRTYWPVRAAADEVEVLRLANRCNASLVLVQFWFNAETGRFFGQYMLPCKDGLDRRQFMRTLRQFAEIFSIAVRERDEDDLLGDSASEGTGGDNGAPALH